MAYNLPDVALTNTWVDITTLTDYGDIANKKITVQAKWVNTALVFVGGTTPPDVSEGILLASTLSVTGTSDHWWVKGLGTLAVLVED